jgi:hypothetical protein
MPANCVLPPIESLMAVRESDAVTAKPPNNPQATFAAPNPRSSLLASTGHLFFAPKLRAVTMPAPKLTISTAMAPGISSLIETPCGIGSIGEGSREGMSPTTRIPRLGKSKAAESAVASATTTSGAGMAGSQALSTRSSKNSEVPKVSDGQ